MGDVVDFAGEPEVGRITIVRRLAPDGYEAGGVIDVVTARGPDGEDMPLTEALGMMRLAEDTLIRDAMGEIDD